MLWRAMLRGTASGLLANAAADAGVDASWFVITSRDMKRGGEYGRVENVDDGGHHPCPLEHLCCLGIAGRTGYMMPGAEQEGHQPPANGA